MTIMTAMNRMGLPLPSLILPLNSMYALTASMPPSMTLKRSDSMCSAIIAPAAVPGIDMMPSFSPREYLILFFTAWVTVAPLRLPNVPNRLLLAISAGWNPRNARTGDIMIPPPKPTIDPAVPAANPKSINQRLSSTKVLYNMIMLTYRVLRWIMQQRDVKSPPSCP